MNFEQYRNYVAAVAVGKYLPTALYLHLSAVHLLPPALWAYMQKVIRASGLEGAGYNILKFAKNDFRVSLLVYPSFDDNPYPALQKSYTLDLENKTKRAASYADSENPPILHRRELFLSPDDPRRAEFAVFTEEGERIGAYEKTRGIGTKQGWAATLRRLGYRVGPDGHLVELELKSGAVESEEGPKAIARHKTALSRTELSVPMFTMASAGFFNVGYSVLDYGCGRGDDLRALIAAGVECSGWDPVYFPDEELAEADIVNLGYVINVIEERSERQETLAKAFKLTNRLLCVSAMLGNEATLEKFKPYKDGVVTKRGTFQKYFFQSELREFIESTLEADAVAAGPGLFFVFKDAELQQQYLANRHKTSIEHRTLRRNKRPTSTASVSPKKIEANRALLEDLWSTALTLGRMPVAEEVEQADALAAVFGSLPKSIAVCKDLFGVEEFERAENIRKNDILVYLALEHFSKRRPYRRMPGSLKRDITYHYGKYNDARTAAQAALFSVSDVELINQSCISANKLLPASVLEEAVGLTFHKQFLNLCPPILRIYVGCALQLYGDLLGIDLIKVHIQSGKVTLLGYDDFDGKVVPRLKERIKVKMAEQDIDFFDYVLGYEPPPLLGKAQYMDKNDAAYAEQHKFDEELSSSLGPGVNEPYIGFAQLKQLAKERGLSTEWL